MYMRVLGLLVLACVAYGLPHECGFLLPPPIPAISNSDLALKQVSIVFRHGDRIMWQDAECWPNDTAVYTCEDRHLSTPSFYENQTEANSGRLFRKKYLENRNYFAGNCETGQLTNKGFEQEMATGAMYRKQYVDSGFLPSDFDPSVTYLRSDEADRCVLSLESMLKGFYPSMANSNYYQIYDINTMDYYYDNIVPNDKICPILDTYLDESRETPEYMEHYQKFTLPLYANLTAALGFTVNSLSQVDQIHDCSVVHACHNQLPSSITPELYDAVMAEFNYNYYVGYTYPSYQLCAQAGIGYFLQELSGFMLDVVNNSTTADQYKLLLFSGHDTTLLPILAAFQSWNGIWAPYASQMQFELYQSISTLEYSIRIAYNGENVIVPGCSSEVCPWSTFYSYLETIFPTGNC